MSCERDDISDQSMGDNNKDSDTILSIRNLNTKDIKEKVELNEEIEKINVNRENKFTARSTNSDSTDTAPIKAEHAIEIISGKNKTYTFQLAPKQGTEDNPALHNIVFIKQDDGSFRTLGITYDFTEEQAETFDKTGQLDGEIHVLFFEIHNLKDQPQLSARSNDAPCANIEGGMDCGSLDEVVITTGGGGSGGGGGGGTSGPGDSPGHNLLKLAPGGGGGGGYTAPVDDDEVIIDPSFEDNECLNGVYKKMRVNDGVFENYIKEFDKETSLADIELSASKSLSDNINAQVSAPLESNQIGIEFNLKNLDRPSLDIARTMVHEIIHATMYRWLLIAAEKGNIDTGEMTREESITYVKNLKNDFPGLYDYYYDRRKPDWSHEQMATHFTDKIIEATKEFNSSKSAQVYEALAWNGLKETESWNELSSDKRKKLDKIKRDYFKNNENCE